MAAAERVGGPLGSCARPSERKNRGVRPQFYTATARPGGRSFSRSRGAGERPKRIAMDCHVATLLAVTGGDGVLKRVLEQAYRDAATVAVKII